MKKMFWNDRVAMTVFVLMGGLIFCQRLAQADIVAYGDCRSNIEEHRKIVEAILPFNPTAVFMLGDLVFSGKDPEQWTAFRNVAAPLLSGGAYFPTPGNHDLGSEGYFDTFPSLKKRYWYAVDREGVHFIVLDSNVSMKPASAQYRWLEADLKGAGPGLKVVVLHHPLFSVGSHEEDEKGLRPVLLPLFKKYGVSAVFAGHDHNYQRLEYDGIVFIVSGGGGAPLYEATRTSPYLKTFRKAYHFCVLSPKDGAVIVRVFDGDSTLFETFPIPLQEP